MIKAPKSDSKLNCKHLSLVTPAKIKMLRVSAAEKSTNNDLQNDSAFSQKSLDKTNSTIKIFNRVSSNPLKFSAMSLRIVTESKFLPKRSSATSTEQFGCSTTRIKKRPPIIKKIALRSRNQSLIKSPDVSPHCQSTSSAIKPTLNTIGSVRGKYLFNPPKYSITLNSFEKSKS